MPGAAGSSATSRGGDSRVRGRPVRAALEGGDSRVGGLGALGGIEGLGGVGGVEIELIALCDGDDVWEPGSLGLRVARSPAGRRPALPGR